MESKKWHEMPRWKKSLYGWLAYQFAAFASLIDPDATDEAMHKTLSDQFKAAKN